MESSKNEEMAMKVIDELSACMKNKIGTCVIKSIDEDSNYRAFSIRFYAYNYFCILFYYDRGEIGFRIQYGKNSFIELENSQKYYEQADFDILCQELQEQLELRIPDEFLEANGWK